MIKTIKKYTFSGVGVGAAGVLLGTLTDPTQLIPTDTFVNSLFQFMGGAKGMTGMSLVIALVQLVMMFFETTLAQFAGKYRLGVVLGLSVVCTLVVQLNNGSSLMAALTNGATLAAVQVFAHQMWSQFVTGDQPAPVPADNSGTTPSA